MLLWKVFRFQDPAKMKKKMKVGTQIKMAK